MDDDDDDDEDEGVGISGARAAHSTHAMRDDDDGDDLEILPNDLDLAAADELFFPGETTDDVDDVKRLSRAWVRERGMAGLTRWQGELVESCLNKLGQQVRAIVRRAPDSSPQPTSEGRCRRRSTCPTRYAQTHRRRTRSTSSCSLCRRKQSGSSIS